MHYLTTDEHRQVVERLLALVTSVKGYNIHAAGWEYTSLLSCFGMHCAGAAQSLLAMHERLGAQWFPATSGYVIVRSLFEIDVNAHFISKDPTVRSKRYIDFEHVIRKNTLEAVDRHRNSPNPTWQKGMQLMYDHEYLPKLNQINASYAAVRSTFEDSKGKRAKSWSGKSIREMAKEVDHLEAYDIFYADLSAFTHVNVMLANRFIRPGGRQSGTQPAWSMRTDDFDVGHVFRYAAIFMSCFLELFGKELSLWEPARVKDCWHFPEAVNRQPTFT